MRYNDLNSYRRTKKIHNVHSNLCTWFIDNRNRFCGNYCCKNNKSDLNLRYCWRHSSSVKRSKDILVLIMIVSANTIFNRNIWKKFIHTCQRDHVPIYLIIYHASMNNGTVREGENLISRFRPVPRRFGQKCVSLHNAHGGTRYVSVYLRLLNYCCQIPGATRCVVITERTIPIRSPLKTYMTACELKKCHVDISYNTAFSKNVPESIKSSGARNKPFPTANNNAQGLFTTEFLKEALPTVPVHHTKFGLELEDELYSVKDQTLFSAWQEYTGSNVDEFLLVNSYLLDQGVKRPIATLKKFMELTVESDKYTVAEAPVLRDGIKRAHVFYNLNCEVQIPWMDARARSYYKNLNNPITLERIIKYLIRNKRRALFFRSVQLE